MNAIKNIKEDMFKRLFSNKTKQSGRLSKVDYWKKWELYELFDELHKAEQLLMEMASDDNEIQFLKFKDDFIEELYEVAGDNVADFTRIWEWFKPTKEWETLIGEKGQEIGRNVFRITDNWKCA